MHSAFRRYFFIGFVLVFGFFNSSYAKEPLNLDLCKEKIVRYHNSGQYSLDQAKVIDKAREYLAQRIAVREKDHLKKPLAIVLDIDETSLSNYPNKIDVNFEKNDKEFTDFILKAEDSVIDPTLKLYRFAKANQVAVFFITGRREDSRESTVKNLQTAGYQNWDGLYLKANEDIRPSSSSYKTASRNEIEKKGFNIVLNMGDQQSDLIGGHADKTFKLPNPFYFVP